MVTKEEAKERVKQLVKEFSEIPKSHLDTMPEEDIKRLFITPLLEALGWNKFDILSESRVLRGRADYLVKIGSSGVLVVEAKKTSVSLSEDEGRQAVSYAYHSKIKFAVLTNFKRLRVYHALSNIKDIDKNLLKIGNAPFRLEFEEYLEKFDWLWLLSKESFQNGEINKLLSAKDERINKPIDKKLLEDLLKIREWLSKELKSKRNDLDDSIIDEIIQILIDRFIFIRSVEDRGLEGSGFLLGISQSVKKQEIKLQLFPYLLEKFIYFNKKYDSKLFEPGLVEKEGAFSDEVLHKVIKALYFGVEDIQSKYMFDQIPGDIFGNIYEQYLGTILAGTGKRVKLDSKSGKRKKMGIYYTPSYIVDYIVKNTVGEYIKNKTIDEILDVKILDPACGSGSFLTRAFLEICNKVEELLKSGEKSEKATFKNYKDRLSLAQKATILTNCIYGVDLDEKAIELARLNLLLKALEGEGPDSRTFLLPHLSNIKCGNSLIDDSKIAKDKAFNWKAQYLDVFSKGGFDVVVGNPPYGADLSEKEREYLEKRFNLGNTDTACLFMGLASELLKKNGINGFIVPKPFVYSSTWEKIRKKLLEGLIEITDCGKVWKEVKLEQIIYFFEKNYKTSIYKSCVRKDEEVICIGDINKETNNEFGFLLNGISEKELEIGRKIKKAGISLNEYVINQRGAIYQKEVINKKSDLFVLGGAQIGRYVINSGIKGYISKKVIKDDKAFIKPNSILVQRLVAHIENPIDHIKITACLSKDIKISDCIIVDTINQLQNKGNISSEFLLSMINSRLMNWYAYRFIFGKAIRTMQFDNPVSERIIIPEIDLSNKKNKLIYEKIISLVNQMLELQKKYHDVKINGNEKERLEQQIKNIDYEIDEEIYSFYGITDEEKKVIEDSLK